VLVLIGVRVESAVRGSIAVVTSIDSGPDKGKGLNGGGKIDSGFGQTSLIHLRISFTDSLTDRISVKQSKPSEDSMSEIKKVSY
jgi:hypothetical protein